MKKPLRNFKSANKQADDAAAEGNAAVSGAGATDKPLPKGYTPPKGRPTPKRKDVEISRGVIRDPSAAPAGTARQRRKELKASMSKQEWKEFKAQEREASRARNLEVQAAIDRGDQRYLMPRDKGEVRAFVRDWVDSRRMFANAVMPMAFVLLLAMLLGNALPEFSLVVSGVAMVLIAAFAIEAVVNGYRVNNAVRERFPGTTETGFSLGYYAFSRGSQPRKWRSPKPRVNVGASI